jgi:sec-independent protein translocase protein TatC
MADVEMTFMEHLEELRKRILYCLYAAIPALLLGFYFAQPILELITWHARTLPISPHRSPLKIGFSPIIGPFVLFEPGESASALVALSPTEIPIAWMKAGLLATLFFVMPFIMFQFWQFVQPGLKDVEKKFLIPFVLTSWISFIIGALFAYLVMLYFAVPFLANFGGGIAVTAWSLANYVNFTLTMILIFGVVFELPVVAGLLSMLGLVTPQFLSKYRRHAILVIFVVAAVLTPPDPITQSLLAVPLIGLYEISIIVVRLTQRKPGGGLVKV